MFQNKIHYFPLQLEDWPQTKATLEYIIYMAVIYYIQN